MSGNKKLMDRIDTFPNSKGDGKQNNFHSQFVIPFWQQEGCLGSSEKLTGL